MSSAKPPCSFFPFPPHRDKISLLTATSDVFVGSSRKGRKGLGDDEPRSQPTPQPSSLPPIAITKLSPLLSAGDFSTWPELRAQFFILQTAYRLQRTPGLCYPVHHDCLCRRTPGRAISVVMLQRKRMHTQKHYPRREVLLLHSVPSSIRQVDGEWIQSARQRRDKLSYGKVRRRRPGREIEPPTHSQLRTNVRSQGTMPSSSPSFRFPGKP